MPKESGLGSTVEYSKKRTKRRILFAIAFCVVIVGLAISLLRRTSNHGDQTPPSAFTAKELAEFTSLEPIDAHTHVSQTGPAFVAMLRDLHMHVLDILYVDDTDPHHSSLETQRQEALHFVDSSQGRARLCTTFDPFRFSKANFSKSAIDGLNTDFAQGALAAKIWKNVGMEIVNASGNYLLPDDPAFEPIYRDIASHGKTLITHAADPDTAWGLAGPDGFRTNYYEKNPQWNMSKKPGVPEKTVILQARDHILEMNPDLRVVGAHFGSMEDRLDDLGAVLDGHPNFAVDTAGRVKRLAYQPSAKVREFFIKYQNRILYGTDLNFYSGTSDQTAARDWERQYAQDWRYFATNDTFEYQGHRVQGTNLPPSVLKKLYHDNAVQWIPGIAGNAR